MLIKLIKLLLVQNYTETRLQTYIKYLVKINHHHKLFEMYVLFDSNLRLHQYSSQVCKSCFYHIRDFRRIRYHVYYILCSAKIISVIVINGRLDYCNSPLNNIAKKAYLNFSVYIIAQH